jgi:hypothetical protein
MDISDAQSVGVQHEEQLHWVIPSDVWAMPTQVD